MPWLRRRRHVAPPAEAVDAPDDTPAEPSPGGLVPLVPAESLERTERALKMLAAQSAQLHGHLVQLEHRVDALSDALVDRLEVNLAARLDAVRADLRAAQGLEDELDLRSLAPTDTGWAAVG